MMGCAQCLLSEDSQILENTKELSHLSHERCAMLLMKTLEDDSVGPLLSSGEALGHWQTPRKEEGTSSHDCPCVG